TVAAYRTGRGSIVMRGKVHIEELRKEREAIVVTEVPYQVNKARMVERIAEVVREKLIEGISDLRDESDRDGVRVVIELRRDAVANIDAVIALIRNAADPVVPRAELTARAWPAGDVAALIALIGEPGRAMLPDGSYRLSDEQAKAILELRLQRLTGLEREKIASELQEVVNRIAEFLEILSNRDRLIGILRAELLEAKEQFGTPRRTELVENEFEQDI